MVLFLVLMRSIPEELTLTNHSYYDKTQPKGWLFTVGSVSFHTIKIVLLHTWKLDDRS